MSLIQITNAGLSLMQAATAPIVLTSYQLGSSAGYIPSPSQTGVQGSVVYTGTVGAPVVADANRILYPAQVPASVGTFTFGEVGYFYGSTLFAILVFDNLVLKTPFDADTNTGGIIVLDSYIPMTGSNYQMWANAAQANVNKVSVVTGPEGLPSSVISNPNIFVVQSTGNIGAFLAYTDRQGLWNFNNWSPVSNSIVLASSLNSVTISVADWAEVTYGGAFTVLLQVTSGGATSAVRFVSNIIGYNGNIVVSLNAPLAIVPQVGDKIRFYTPGFTSTGTSGPGGGSGGPGDGQIPDPITGLGVVGNLSSFTVTFNSPTYLQDGGNLYTQIYGAVYSGTGPLPVFANANPVAEAIGLSNTVIIPADPGVTMCFWAGDVSTLTKIRQVDVLGPTGGLNGVEATTGQNPQPILALLTGQITSSQLYSDLADQITLISADGTVQGSVAYQVAMEAQARAAAIASEAQARSTAIQQEVSDRAAAITAEAQQRATDIANEATARGTAISTEQVVRQTADAALATSITNLSATVGQNTAAIQTESTTRASADSANASQISTLVAVTNTAQAAQTNLLLNPGFVPSGLGWATTGFQIDGASAPGVQGQLLGSTATGVPTGAPTAYVYQSSGRNAYALDASNLVIQYIPVTPGEIFDASVWLASASLTTTDSGLQVIGYDANKNAVAGQVQYIASIGSGLGTWTQVAGSYTIAPGVYFLNINLFINQTSGVGTNIVYYAQPTVMRRAASATQVMAAITNEATVRSSADQALSTQINTVSSSIGPTVNAAVATEAQTRATADTALATSISSLTSTVNSNTSSIATEATTRAAADSANATQISVVSSTFGVAANIVPNAGFVSGGTLNWAGSMIAATTTGVPSGAPSVNVLKQVGVKDGFAYATGSTSPSMSPVAVGEILDCSVWIASAATSAYAAGMTLACYASNGTTQTGSIQVGFAIAKSTWAQVSGSYTIPAGTAFIACDLSSNQASGGPDTIYYANPTITRRSASALQVNAAITNEATTRASADSALTTQFNNLSSSLGSTNSNLSSEQTTRAAADSALAQSITNLTTTVNNNTSAITNEATTRANNDTTLSNSINALTSSVALNAAAIQTESTTRAAADSANASQINTLVATSNVVSSAATNLVTNPGFVPPAAGIGSGWDGGLTLASSSAGGVPLGAPSSYVGYYNGRDCLMRNIATPIYYGYIPVTPGEILDCSVWIGSNSTTSVSTGMLFSACNSTQQNVGYPTAAAGTPFTAGPGWYQVAGSYTVPAGVYFVVPDLQINQTAPGVTIYFANPTVNRRAGGTSAAMAAIVNEASVRSAADSTNASNITALQVIVGQNSTAIQTESTARIAANNQIFAEYSVKIDTNGYVTGYGLISQANNGTPTSQFIVRADQFAIAAPSGPGISPLVPFIVQTTPEYLNGQYVAPGVYITSASIQNGSIVDAQIANLNAGKILSGSIAVSAYIQSSNYVAGSSGWIINGNGNAEFAAASIRGQLTASQINSNGLQIKDSNGTVILGAGLGQQGGSDAATNLGFNPTFAVWPSGSTYPTGWSQWSGSAPGRATSPVTAGSPYSVYYQIQSSDAGNTGAVISATLPTPLPAGTTVTGSFMIYIGTNNGGGGPGYLMRLFTNSAQTTYTDNLLQVPNFGVGGWQRIPFTATAGGQIYGIQLYQMASWTGFVGGAWAVGSGCYFGPLTFDFNTPINSNQLSTSLNNTINNKLNANAASVLSSTISINATAGAGFVAGNLTWDGSGNITGGYGVAMTPGGIVARNTSGVNTIVLNAATGQATFGGTLVAGTATRGSVSSSLNSSVSTGTSQTTYINSGTITGPTQTIGTGDVLLICTLGAQLLTHTNTPVSISLNLYADGATLFNSNNPPPYIIAALSNVVAGNSYYPWTSANNFSMIILIPGGTLSVGSHTFSASVNCTFFNSSGGLNVISGAQLYCGGQMSVREFIA